MNEELNLNYPLYLSLTVLSVSFLPCAVEAMLVEMILDNKLDAVIDQSTDQVILRRAQQSQSQSLEERRMQQLGEWAVNIEKVSSGFASRLS